MVSIAYEIIESFDPVEFAVYVENRINQGWTPQGGVCVTKAPTGSGYLYSQAMILKVE